MFTPLETSIGALLIQFATTSYLWTTGNTIGFSSLLFNTLNRSPSINNFSIIAGLFLSLILAKYWIPQFIPVYDNTASSVYPWRYLISGGLVGFGTQRGCGCTSGHMINGLSRLRKRSIVATMIFVSTAIITTYLMDLGETCPDNVGGCYQYDHTFTKFNDNRSLIQLIAILGFISSYILCPMATINLASTFPRLIQFINCLNAGLFFGFGLIISGMIQPSKTLGFLSILNWDKFDPSLALIIVFTIIPNMIIWNSLILKTNNSSSLSHTKFNLNNANNITWNFCLGNALFGIGWGSLGICPGPGIIGIVLNGTNGISWVLSFLICYKISSLL